MHPHLRSRHRRASYDPAAYTPDLLAHWISEGERQAAKDRVLLPRIAALLGPGRVLELGAGAGQLAAAAARARVRRSRVRLRPVLRRASRLAWSDARRVDAVDIAAAGLGRFPNIFAQSITPLITSDRDVILATYRSLRAALEPRDRLVHIDAQAGRGELTATMRAHAELASEAGLRDVRVLRNQLLPSRAYEPPLTDLAGFADRLLGTRLGSRFVLAATAE